MALNFANNNSLSAITSLPASITGGVFNLISTQTASSSATIDFTSGIDSTYKEYIFKFYNIHPATNEQNFTFQVDTGTNTNYNQTITSTFFRAYHQEDDGGTALGYLTSRDQAQGTSFQPLTVTVGNDNDQCTNGTLHLFNPSSTTFVKHFFSRFVDYEGGNQAVDNYCAGYMRYISLESSLFFHNSSVGR